jgi:hypothetical protein
MEVKMNDQELYAKTATILNVVPAAVEAFCIGGDEHALLLVEPDDLAAQIREYWVCHSCGLKKCESVQGDCAVCQREYYEMSVERTV